MLQCLGAEEEKKLLWLFELRNFFLSFSSKFRAKNFSYIVQRRCRNSKSKRRGFLFNFCFPVFVFTVFPAPLLSSSVSFIRKHEKKPNSLKEEEVYADLMLVSSRVCNSESPPNPRIGFISKKTTQSLDIHPPSSSSLYYIFLIT